MKRYHLTEFTLMVCRENCCEITPNMTFSEYYFEDPRGKTYADKCWNLLKRLDKQTNSSKEFGLFETRKHGMSYICCWYVGFRKVDEKKVCYILHFDIEVSDIKVHFRCTKGDYVPINEQTKDFYQDPSNGFKNTSYNKFVNAYGEDNLVKIIKEYLKNIKKNYSVVEKQCRKREPCGDQRGKR